MACFLKNHALDGFKPCLKWLVVFTNHASNGLLFFKQVEMLDVATILRDCSAETLVLVDELGR